MGRSCPRKRRSRRKSMPSSQVSADRQPAAAPPARRRLRAMLVAATLLLLAPAAEAAGLRAASHDGFGRLVFDFDRATQFEASIEGDRLVVRFEQPFAAKLDPVL